MNNDEHKILKTIGRILLLIILTATIAGVVCLVFNLLDELSAINKAAQTNQGKVGEMWASFSIRKHYGQGHKRQTTKRGLLTTNKG